MPVSYLRRVVGAYQEANGLFGVIGTGNRGCQVMESFLRMKDARIVAVCDVYDALTSPRPYRSEYPEEHALEIVRGESGK